MFFFNLKNKTFFFVFCLSLLLLITHPFKAHSIPIGGITKIIKGLGKGTDLISPGSKMVKPSAADEAIKKFEKLEMPNELNANTLLNKDATRDEILNSHGIGKIDKALDGQNVVDAVVDKFTGDGDKEIINTIRIALWTGRVFRSSNVFNQPELEERLIIQCQADDDLFTFTALLNKNDNESLQEQKNWFLLSQHFPNSKLTIDGSIVKNQNSNNVKSLPKQELIILEDTDEYIIFSNKVTKGQNYPTKYFAIFVDGKFLYLENIQGTESPEYIKNTLDIKISKSEHICVKKI
jgi:hypothetical protein